MIQYQKQFAERLQKKSPQKVAGTVVFPFKSLFRGLDQASSVIGAGLSTNLCFQQCPKSKHKMRLRRLAMLLNVDKQINSNDQCLP